MKRTTFALLAALFGCFHAGCASPASTGGDPQDRLHAVCDVFMEQLAALKGVTFTGHPVFQIEPGPPWEGARLRAVVRDVSDSEIRVPFTVDDDRSRTWVFTRRAEGLHLLHDHRYPDGAPHDLTDYGGCAESGSVIGGVIRLSFPADAYTASILPEASTNAWTFILDPAAGTLVYDLERHERPRFRAELRDRDRGLRIARKH